MKRILMGAVALTMGVGLAMPQGALAGHNDTRTYVAAGGDANVLDLNSSVPGAPGIGGAIFTKRAGETTVKITIADAAAGAKVAWYYQFDDDDPLTDSTAFGDVCGKASQTFTIPAGYTSIGIFVDQAWQAVGCDDLPTKYVPGTTGTITAQFTP